MVDVARDHPVLRMDQSIDEAFRIMEEFKVDAVPVVDEDERIVGVVSLRDLISAFQARGFKPLAETVSEAMTVEGLEDYIVTPDTTVNKVWSKFVFRGIPALVVVRSKEEPVPIGIITPFDLIRKGDGGSIERSRLERSLPLQSSGG